MALHRVDGKLTLDQVTTKTSVAVLPIPAPLVTILRGHRKRQFEERFAAGSLWRDTGLVFTTAHGGYVEPRNVNRMFHRLCEIANVPQLQCTTFDIPASPALHDGCAAGNGATDPAPQLDHGDHGDLRRGNRGGTA
jgi:hypothetical protein